MRPLEQPYPCWLARPLAALLLVALALLRPLGASAQSIVSTLAGSTAGSMDGAGSAAQFRNPAGVAVDGTGNVYVADTYNNRIRKVTSAGVVTTLAGSGAYGFADGAGNAAQFNLPIGVAVDRVGNVYVADYGNNRIRKVSPTGVVTTLAGSTFGYADGAGSAAQFRSPYGVAVDGTGNVYVADTNNHRIRQVSSTGTVTTLAGSGTAGFADGAGSAARFSGPVGVVVDGVGSVYVADTNNNRIRQVSPTGVVTTLAGSGTAGFADGAGSTAQFDTPYGVAVDGAGNVYVAGYNHRIRLVTSTGVVTTLAGSGIRGFADGAGSAAQFNLPYGVAVDGTGNVYVADQGNNRIRQVSPIAMPTLTSLSPNPAAVGTSLTLTGTNLTGATAVTFTSSGGVATAAPAGYVVAGSTSVTGIGVPAGLAPGLYTLTITTPSGTSNGLAFAVVATVPVITSFGPLRGPIGTSVTFTGTGFSPVASQNAVFFGATLATVTAASATSLTVTVPLGATYQYPTVTNLATNLTAYASQPFVVTLGGAVAFAPKVDVSTGVGLGTVAIGDVDGDGLPDLATTSTNNNTVSVLRNTSTAGTISFAAGVSFPVGAGSFAVAIGDVDGDGKPDLATSNYNDNTVSVLRNTSTAGTVSFAAGVSFPTGYFPVSVSIGDVNGDGKPDLAVANFFVDNTVSVLRNTSMAGTVSFAARVDFQAGAGLQWVSIGDVDGDNKPDLATVNYTDNTLSVLRNTSTVGTVSFAARVNLSTGAGPSTLAIGDVDGDGQPDLTTANYLDNMVSVLRNTSTAGTVSFAARVNVGTNATPNAVAIGDVDGDGQPDLATTNYADNTVSVLRNTSTAGTVSFAARVDAGTGASPKSVAIGDMDGDGKPDLTTANYADNTVSVLRQVSSAPLPVVLTQFAATAEGPAAVRLTWATASEKNSRYFKVERSTDGVAFATIGTVAAAGTTATAHAYALRDAALPTGASVLYYRLRQVDLDGTAHYSPVRVVALGGSAAALFPNPAHGTATLTGVAAGQAVQVLDARGRLVLTATADAGGTTTLALPAGLPSGVYVVRAGQQALRLTVE